ncbi:MAG: glycoside hydrolase family 127 protein [Oscillospiraceae bacterium]|nr:glycoside hydrolase family 127 protein [Oscillospiraceae bacterium]
MKSYSKHKHFPLGCITAKSFLYDQLQRNKEGMGGNLDKLEPGMIADPFLHKSYVPVWGKGDQSGWGAEISGNFWSGLIANAFTMNDPQLIKKVTDFVDELLKKQRDDGYLGTFTEPNADIYDDYNGWGTACILRGLLMFYEATARQDVLDAVHKDLLWFCRNWAGDKKTSYTGIFLTEPMVLCYHLTGDQRLIDFCEEYSEYLCKHDIYQTSYRSLLKGLIYNSNHTAGMGIVSRLPALLYSATGNKEYLKASERILDDIYKKATHLSGSPVSVNEFLAPVASTAETEYCSYTFYTEAFAHMGNITGKSKYGERMEEMFYNGAQGARKKDERAIAYLSAPNQFYATDNSSSAFNNMQVYAPCYPVSCCPVTSVALLGEFVRSMMSYDGKNNIYINAYGPCALHTDALDIVEDTMYPFENSVVFRFERTDKKERGVCLRIPSWCTSYEIRCGKERISGLKNVGGYVKIRRVWKKGDTLKITFNTEVRVLRVNDDDGPAKHPIAVKFGALLFSFHVPEQWSPYEGTPCTPLPKGWYWYRVNPDFTEADEKDYHNRIGLRRNQITWNLALSPELSAKDISVKHTKSTGYVWEDPRITLRLKAYKAPFLCAPYPQRTFEPFGDKQIVTKELDIELVPYGCTNLRLTYFPVADLPEKGK